MTKAGFTATAIDRAGRVVAALGESKIQYALIQAGMTADDLSSPHTLSLVYCGSMNPHEMLKLLREAADQLEQKIHGAQLVAEAN